MPHLRRLQPAQAGDEQPGQAAGVVAGVARGADAEVADAAHHFICVQVRANLAGPRGGLEQLGADRREAVQNQVLGLARTDQAARSLSAAGAEVHRGDLEDLEGVRRVAAGADGVIHTAFNHDFSNFAQHSETDRRAIETLGEALEGSDRPLIVTAGLPITLDRATTEDDALPAGAGSTPRVSKQTALALTARGVRAVVLRMSQVHDRDKQGLATHMIALARQQGVSAYVGAAQGRWPAVHRLGVAPLYRLALERSVAGVRYHAVAEEGVLVRAMAEAIGRGPHR